MNHLKLLSIAWSIAILAWWLGAWYYYWVALPSYNQQIIDIQIKIAQEKKESEEKIAQEKKDKEDEVKIQLESCLSDSSKLYRVRWSNACEVHKKSIDLKIKNCKAQNSATYLTEYREMCIRNAGSYEIDENGNCYLRRIDSDEIEKEKKEWDNNCYIRNKI